MEATALAEKEEGGRALGAGSLGGGRLIYRGHGCRWLLQGLGIYCMFCLSPSLFSPHALANTLPILSMLAVMTFNVGYFLAVLGGVFFGELIFGRWIRGSEH